MPLSDESIFGVESLTEAINQLPETPSIIGDLGIFKKEFLTTTTVTIERKENTLSLVENKPIGSPGEPVKFSRHPPKTFHMMHLPQDDIVRAKDVQNVKAFGTQNSLTTVLDAVNDKLAMFKENNDYTIEHARLGALKGKILDKDGKTVITDIYKEFGLTRKTINWELSNANTKTHTLIDNYKNDIKKLRKGESVTGYVCLCSAEFMNEYTSHKSVMDAYLRFQDSDLYRNGDTDVEFIHKKIKFIVYGEEFESGLKIDDDEGIIFPLGTRQAFREYYGPADMVQAVNTKALAHYASREPLGHGKGWSLHAQSNPLPLVLRPDLVQTIRLT